MKKILRVFPRRTSYTPDDDLVCIGLPEFLIPEHDEVHISCTFTWDRLYCEELKFQWEARTDKPVKIGGVAFNSECYDFIPGMYIKKNIIFTSRGCNNNCPWCIVHRLEGDQVAVVQSDKGKESIQIGVVSEMYFTNDMELMIVVKHISRGQWGIDVFASVEDALIKFNQRL